MRKKFQEININYEQKFSFKFLMQGGCLLKLQKQKMNHKFFNKIKNIKQLKEQLSNKYFLKIHNKSKIFSNTAYD